MVVGGQVGGISVFWPNAVRLGRNQWNLLISSNFSFRETLEKRLEKTPSNARCFALHAAGAAADGFYTVALRENTIKYYIFIFRPCKFVQTTRLAAIYSLR